MSASTLMKTESTLSNGQKIELRVNLSRLDGLKSYREIVRQYRAAISDIAATFATMEEVRAAAGKAGVEVDEIARLCATDTLRTLIERPRECESLGFGAGLLPEARTPRDPREPRRLIASKLPDGGMEVIDQPLTGEAAA